MLADPSRPGIDASWAWTGPGWLMRVCTPKTLTFLAVGGAGYVVDVVAFNWLRSTEPLQTLDPSIARVLAMSVAMVVTYLGNRVLTWRSRPARQAPRQLFLFGVFNLTGLVLSLIPLFISHDLLGMRSALADNVSANGVGLALGTLFRYWAYDRFVFSPEPTQEEPVVHARVAS